jgi:hypothetical protein
VHVLPDDQPWVFDLISPDDAVRAAALARHRAVLAGASVALHRANRIWAQHGYDRATFAAYERERQRTITGLVGAFSSATDPAVSARYAPYAVLYLRWEAAYLPELRDSWPCSPWTTKEVVLRRLDRGGVPGDLHGEVAELIVAALRRPYRCKDWMYACLLHQVSPGERIADLDDDRARFARHVAAHPELKVKRVTYGRWLAAQPAR